MLKNLLSSDPAAALDKTRAKLASVEENIAGSKRAEVLLTAEDAGAVIGKLENGISENSRERRLFTTITLI
jgi:hypothetical protein